MHIQHDSWRLNSWLLDFWLDIDFSNMHMQRDSRQSDSWLLGFWLDINAISYLAHIIRQSIIELFFTVQEFFYNQNQLCSKLTKSTVLFFIRKLRCPKLQLVMPTYKKAKKTLPQRDRTADMPLFYCHTENHLWQYTFSCTWDAE